MNSKAYLKGVLDGDGFVDRLADKRIIGLVCKSKFFIKNFQRALENEGLPTVIRKVKPPKPHKLSNGRIIKTTSIFYRIRKAIPEDISGIYRQNQDGWERWKLYIYRQKEIEKFRKIIGERK